MGAGKWIGGIIGSMTGGSLGVLAGYALGSLIDLGSNPANDTIAYSNEHTKEGVFAGQRSSFLFSMLAMAPYIIWADGRIMHSEMECVRSFLQTNFGVAAVGKGEWILLNLFEQRKRMDMQNPLTFRNTICDYGMQIVANLTYGKRLQLLGFLANVARSDNNVYYEEIEALKKVAAYMGLSEKEVESMFNLGDSSLDAAYKVLEIDPTIADEEVRTTHRKLVLKYHPDRVATLGEGIKHATEEKLRSTNNVREAIYKARGMK